MLGAPWSKIGTDRRGGIALDITDRHRSEKDNDKWNQKLECLMKRLVKISTTYYITDPLRDL
jgi:hypothetical protein